eukprot:458136_1
MAAKRKGGVLSINTETNDYSCSKLLQVTASNTSKLYTDYTQYSEYTDKSKYEINIDICKWLDSFMYWQLMWVIHMYTPKKNQKKSRNRIINLIGLVLSVSCLGIWGYLTFKDYNNVSPTVSPTPSSTTVSPTSSIDVDVGAGVLFYIVTIIISR